MDKVPQEISHEGPIKSVIRTPITERHDKPPKDLKEFEERLGNFEANLRDVLFGFTYNLETGKTLKREKSTERIVEALCNFFLSSENGPRYFVLFNGYAAMGMNDNAQVILTTEFTKDPASWIWEHGEEVRSLEFKEKMKYPSSWFWENGSYKYMWNGGKALAINNHAVVVGYNEKGAVIWENGEVTPLYDLLENPEGWEKLCIAEDINDRGEIVGYGIYQGCQSAFLLTP